MACRSQIDFIAFAYPDEISTAGKTRFVARGSSRRPVAGLAEVGLLTIQASLLAALVMIVSSGCDASRESSITDTPFQSIDFASDDCELEVLALLRRDVAGKIVARFAVRNAAAVDCRLLAAAMRWPDDVPGASTEPPGIFSNQRVPAQSIEFVLLQLDPSRRLEGGELLLSWEAGGTRKSSAFPMHDVRAVHAIDRIGWSWDLREMYLYLVAQRSDAGENAVEPTDCQVQINRRPVEILSRATYRGTGGRSTSALCVARPVDLVEGDRYLVEITDSHGAVFASMGKLFSSFVTAENQYAFPLRAVSVAASGDGLHVVLYNESNLEKPDLVIDGVFWNGRDVTSLSRLPKDPLPADRGQYMADQRGLWLPVTWIDKRGRLAINYHLIPGRLGELNASSRDVQQMVVEVQRGLSELIGVSGSPALPGSICLHHGGLLPESDLLNVPGRQKHVSDLAASIPTYIRTVEGIQPRELAAAAIATDFVVCSVSGLIRQHSNDPIAATLEYLGALKDRNLDFVASLEPDPQVRFDGNDVRWLTLAALANGSRGVLFPKSGSQFAAPAALSDIHESRSIKLSVDEQAVAASLFAGAAPIDLLPQCNAQGVYVRCLALGTERIAVIVLNEWCTRASGQGQFPFSAVPRRDSAIDLNPPLEWDRVSAWDVGTGGPVTLSSSRDGAVRIHLARLEIGRVIVVENGKSLRPGPRPAPLGIFAEPNVDNSAEIAPTASPFVRFGRVEAGETVPFAFPIANQSARDVDVRVVSVVDPAEAEWKVQTDPCTLSAGAMSELTGTLTAPDARSRGVARLRVEPNDAAGAGFDAFIDAESFIPVCAQPSFLDFGTFGGPVGPSWKRIELVSEIGALRNIQAQGRECPIESRAVSGGTALEMRPHPPIPGEFRTAIELSAEDEAGRRHKLEIRATGLRVSEVRAQPDHLVLVAQAPGARQVHVRHVTNAPCQIEKVGSPDNRILARAVRLRDGQAGVSVEVAGDANIVEEIETIVSVRARLPGGNDTVDLRIPVRVVGAPALPVSDGRSSPKAARAIDLARRVAPILDTFRELSLPEDAGNWVQFHRLLIFAEQRDLSPQALTLLRSVLDTPPVRAEPFLLNRGTPVPRRAGSLFDREHHRDQFLLYMSLANVPQDSTFRSGQSWFTIDELLSSAKWDVRNSGELCWSAPAFAHYLPAGSTWRNKFGEQISLGTLYRSILQNPTITCGGSHELTSIACVVSKIEHRSDPVLAEIWPELESRLTRAAQILRSGQRPDGAFSVPAFWKDDDPRMAQVDDMPCSVGLHYTGHTLEWLSQFLTPEELHSDWILKAVEYLVEAFNAEYPDGRNILPLGTDDRTMAYGYSAHALLALSRWQLRALASLSR